MTTTLADLIRERFGTPPGGGGGPAGAEGGQPAGARHAGGDMAAEGPLATILARRTLRRYTGDPVPDDLLAVLLACAQSAPSKSDLQAWSVVVVKAPEARRTIAGLLPAMPWVAEAPAFLVFLGDMRRNVRICGRHGRPHANNNLDSFFNAAVDGALAMQTFILAAEAAGLGCCAISHVRNHMETVTELLGLPEGVFPIAGLCVGWPAGKGRISMRLPPALVVHQDRYDDGALERELESYDARRHAHAPLGPDQQKNAAAYGTSEVCTWSDNVSRQLSIPEREGFGEFLRGHGFELT